MTNIRVAALAAALAGSLMGGAAQAASLLGGLGGPQGFGELSQGRNDDGSSSQLNLPFTLNFFGANFSTFFVNNNGNVTFGGPLGRYTPIAFPVASQRMIAPYWGDVDTSCAACGAVYVAAPNPDTAVVTWHDVGFYSSNASRTNDFQLVLLNRADTGAGNFDIQFRYNRLQWTTGDASGGSGGLGGTPAQAGYDAGNGTNFFTLPGSRTAAVLDLANTSNVSTATPGLWSFTIRNGAITDGASAATPVLPTVATPAGFVFNLNVVINQRIFIDPLVAVGYDYTVGSGPNVLTALFPVLPTDTNGYDVFGYDSAGNLVLLGSVAPGGLFDFGTAGVSRFAVRGIDGGLDPNNPLAFVTGLTFAATGAVTLTQAPVTVFVAGPGTSVPEPASLLALLGGLAALGGVRGRTRVA